MRTILLLLGLSLGVQAADRPPNIVLILADDLGYSDLSCYGAKQIRTPNLDRMAKDGIRFTNFLVAQPVCTASRAALMTGCYPNRVGLSGALNHTSLTGIHPDEELLPELLKARGYATACYGKWHLGTRPEFDPTRNGFDTWQGLPYSNDNGPLHPVIRDIPALPYIADGKTIERDPDQSQFTKRFTTQAINFIKAHREEPFFVYLPHVMPHVPIFASKPFQGRSKLGLYGDVVEELDASIGDLLKTFTDEHLESNTIVIFFSDNGPFLSYGTHAGKAEPYREGKLTTFEGGVRVPFIVRWPGRIPAGEVSNELITELDLLPSLVKLAGAKNPRKTIDGLDLLATLLGESSSSNRKHFAYYSGTELHAVRYGKWKLHFAHEYLTVNGPPGTDGKPANYANMKPLSITESGIRGIASRHGYKVQKLPQSLFDLDTDPGETTDVSDKHPEIVKRLAELAETYRSELGDRLTARTGKGVREVGKVQP